MRIWKSVKEAFHFFYIQKDILYMIFAGMVGFFFPLIAIVYKMEETQLPYSWESVVSLHKSETLLYIIDLAPLLLGMFGYATGGTEMKALKLVEKQKIILTTDSFTGLQNAYASDILLKKYKGKVGEKEGYLTVILISIRNLKRINSIMGIYFGNQSVLKFVEILRDHFHSGEKIFRRSGNEFMVVHFGEPLEEKTTLFTKRFLQPIKVLNSRFLIELNIGLSFCTERGSRCNHILDDAYIAMEQHKKRPNQGFILFSDELRRSVVDLEMETELFCALEEEEYFLVYQPVVDSVTKEIHGLEALIRWNSQKYGVVSPVVFVPILERTNLIVDVGFWIMEEACRQIKIWQEMFDNEDLFISINVSIGQLFDVSFIEKVNEIIKRVGVRKETLRLEITESVSDEKRNFVRNIFHLLHQNGFRLSIDDFGTGYSSLSELDSMPLYSIKVDKSFVDKIGIQEKTSSVVDLIVSLSHKMGLKVVVEGVETAAQYQYLRSIRADFIQGYYFSKPLKKDEFERLVYLGISSKYSKTVLK